MSTSDTTNLSNNNPVNEFLREALLAIGLVLLILGSLWIATGQFPPMVVVESGSMMHDTEDGSLGAIDPGDLVLVMNPNRVDIVTYVEAMDEGNQNFGYTSFIIKTFLSLLDNYLMFLRGFLRISLHCLLILVIFFHYFHRGRIIFL